MSEQETLPPEVHLEVALLPWYVNGTLGAQERQQVTRHLGSCPGCRRELDELTQMLSALPAAFAAQPEPSPRIARLVLAKVAQEATARQNVSAEAGSWLNRLDGWFRSLFLPQWVPTLTAVSLVALLGLLLWATMPPMLSEQITTRSLGSPNAIFKVRFQEQATEGQIRALLNSVRGRVIDGPTADGSYLIEVLASDTAAADKKLETVRGRTDVIQRADAIMP
jgi:Putative zinc-finger